MNEILYPVFMGNIAQKILDPNLRDGVHEWRDGQRFVKDGDRLYLEGTDTLAGRLVIHLFVVLYHGTILMTSLA